MTVTSTRPARTLKKPAWLLIASLPPFVAFLFVAAATLSDKVDYAAQLTTDQLADIRPAWVLMHVLWSVPVVLASTGLYLLAGRVPGRFSSLVRVLAPAAVVLMTVYFVVELLLLGADGPTLGDSSLYRVGLVASIAGYWAVIVATIVTGVDLARQRIARKTALVVVVLAGLFLVFDLLTYLPAFVGATDLVEATGLPPFLLSAFWAILGGGLLRSRVPSEA